MGYPFLDGQNDITTKDQKFKQTKHIPESSFRAAFMDDVWGAKKHHPLGFKQHPDWKMLGVQIPLSCHLLIARLDSLVVFLPFFLQGT